MKTLLVDDNQDYRYQLKCLLESDGLAVQDVASGEEALALLENEHFHLLITDLNMPGMNGLTLANKTALIAPEMPVIMNTGSISPEITRLAEQAGIRTIFPKPLNYAELLETIREVTGIR